MISNSNRAAIFRLCTALGIDVDQRHDLAHQCTGKESLKEMSDKDAKRFISMLSELARKQGIGNGRWTAERSIMKGTQRNVRRGGSNVYNLMSQEQREKVAALSSHIYGKFDERSMDSFCIRQFRKPFRALSSDEAIKLIEIQKSMLERKIKKGESR